ncbi:MAG: DUF552 domain-containing protein [Thermoplasmata archaeon]|nr:MAG: DUF552 domain-containing protein [Thermoplasmata archaeon]
MGIVNKIFGEKKMTGGIDKSYIDLEEYVEKTTTPEKEHATMYVRVGEIQRYEDLKTLTDYVCGGNVLILDFSPLADEEVILKRVTNEIKKVISDINGDVVGIGNNLMIITPTGVKIDRRKLRGEYS